MSAAVASPADERCLHHPDREAAARCPGCRRAFCRECVTEHGGRMLCAACIARDGVGAATVERGRLVRLLRPAGRALRLAAGVVVAWWAFHLLGATLALFPEALHEGSAPPVEERAGETDGGG